MMLIGSRGRSRSSRPRDTTPVTVQVRTGTLVYFNGEQQGGLIDNVPKHIAAHWARHQYVDLVDQEPAGAASTPTPGQAAAKTAPSRASDELRDTSTTPTGRGSTGLPPASRLPFASVKNGLYALGKIGPEQPDYGVELLNALDDNAIRDISERSQTSAELRESADSDATAPRNTVRVRTGSRQCPNCNQPVSGRRKWCSEACRLKAYRDRPS